MPCYRSTCRHLNLKKTHCDSINRVHHQTSLGK
uniref:Uncharacterized protein n=1 Tax=Anguilla anguilla TaxID=7936 RepID=A0A0E9R2A8_ANGAN